MRNAPNWTGSFSGVSTFPLANSAALTLQAGVHFQTKIYFDQFNDPSKGLGLYDANNNQGAYSVEIVRLGFRPAGGRCENQYLGRQQGLSHRRIRGQRSRQCRVPLLRGTP